MDALPVLARCALFDGVPSADLEPLSRLVSVRRFPRDAYLFHEGDPAGPVYIVVQGIVRVVRVGRRGEESVLGLLGADGVLGDLTLLDDEAERTASAQALEPTECLSLPRAAVRELVVTHPAAMSRLVARLGDSIRRKDRELAELAHLDVTGRVAARLLALADSYGRPTDRGTRIDLRLSQRTLADMVGASRENVNRAMSALAAQGAIRLESGRITILDAVALRRRS